MNKVSIEQIKEFIADEVIFSMLMKMSEFVKNSEKYSGKCYIAGGFVRDFIMGHPSKDIDICVELDNGGIELAKDLANYFNIKKEKIIIFERFGTAMLPMEGIDIEFVATRTEKYNESSGRKPEVDFGTIKEDVERRDFTVNSLLMSLNDFSIIDMVGGIDDINKKIIKTPNEPIMILKEDPLRILRAIRFAGRYEWEIEESLDAAIKSSIKNLNEISKERVIDEVKKMLDRFTSMHANLLCKYNLVSFILGVSDNRKIDEKDFFEAMANASEHGGYISILFEGASKETSPEILDREMRSMRLSKDDTRLMQALRLGRSTSYSSRLWAHRMNQLGEADLANKLYSKNCKNNEYPIEWLEAPIIIFDGNDLIRICKNRKKGKWISEAIDAQIEEWDKNPYYNEEDLKNNDKFMKAIS